MKLLFIHNTLPGQFEHLMRALARDPRNEVVGIGQEFLSPAPLFGVRVETYTRTAPVKRKADEFLCSNEEAIGNGLAVAAKLGELKRSGFVPDIAIAHLGWGESIYFKDIYPTTPLLGYCEFYHRARAADADFDPTFPLGLNDLFRIRTANAAKLLGLVGMDLGVSPTAWQKSLFPPEFQRKIAVVHEGVDISRYRPDPQALFRLPDGRTLSRADPVVTYAARSLEPYRGFPQFLRAAAELCRRRRDCQIVIAGGDGPSYGPAHDRNSLLQERPIDRTRVHFVGPLPPDDYVKLLQVSSVHVYLTVPFVLSWSLLEAMAVGCVVVGSDTPPVREIVRHGVNGLLADFFSVRQIVDMVERVLDHPQREWELGLRARADVVASFDHRQAVRRYRELIAGLLSSQRRGQGVTG
ncbi:glycosyltransferase [Candidatus Methylocalor cossyra]|uniref:Glycosyltransferase involved in cell wall bisynthesis n=1 Tax=Candidatus Methylocalor cossyra TaxID=3108543 RepID=A0ABM9NHL1_9GAMM